MPASRKLYWSMALTNILSMVVTGAKNLKVTIDHLLDHLLRLIRGPNL